MGMTIDESIENLVLIKKLEDSLGNISGNTNSVASRSLGCAIDTMRKYQMYQADYENRLKADMVAMLTDIQLEMESLRFGQPLRKYVVDECLDVILKKIKSLKET